MKMNPKYLIVLIGFFCVYETQAASVELTRQKRASEFNMIDFFMKVEGVLNNCKKANPPPANNKTNPLIQFIEEHDIQCMINGFIKIYQDMNPKDHSRKKRDALSVMMELLQLQENIQKCKKPNAPPMNGTNIVETIMNDYNIECLFETVMDFVKKVYAANSQNQQSRRKRDTSDIIMELIKLHEDAEKCRKPNATSTNSTNFYQTIMNEYDLNCLTTTIINFVEKIAKMYNNNRRSKRALDFADITCFAMKFLNEEPKISQIAQAFRSKSPSSNSRRKRMASSEKSCADFGVAMDAILQLVLDFAPQ